MTARSTVHNGSPSRYRVLRGEWLEPREMLSGQGLCEASTADASVNAPARVAQEATVACSLRSTASLAVLGLNAAHSKQTQAQFSSGQLIVEHSADAVRFAVSKNSEIANWAAKAAVAFVDISFAQDFLKAQDKVFQKAADILGRMSELAALAQDSSKINSLADYVTEFKKLQTDLSLIGQRVSWGGINLFSDKTTASSWTVYTNEDRTTSTTVSQAAFTNDPSMSTVIGSGTAIDTVANAESATKAIDTALSTLATMRDQNESENSKLAFSNEMLSSDFVAITGSIDVLDDAVESTQLERLRTLQQASIAALAQANPSIQSVLNLLG